MDPRNITLRLIRYIEFQLNGCVIWCNFPPNSDILIEVDIGWLVGFYGISTFVGYLMTLVVCVSGGGSLCILQSQPTEQEVDVIGGSSDIKADRD